MTTEPMSQNAPPKGLGGWTVLFCGIYIAIHIGLNLTGGGSHELEWPPFQNLVNEISGPFTIGIATSILILSFGMFLHHGARDIAIAYPQGIISSFLIFIVGLIIIQCAGHAQIYVNECSRPSAYVEFAELFENKQVQFSIDNIVNSKPNDCKPSTFWNIFAIVTYLMVLFCIALLDKYHELIYAKLKDQIPIKSNRIILNLEFTSLIGGFSFAITVFKAIIILFLSSNQDGYALAKATVSGIVILLEIILFMGVFSAHYKNR